MNEMTELVASLRQEYAESEADHDRNPTDVGFVEWLARRATASREAVQHVLALAPDEYRQRIVAARAAGADADADYWRWCGQAEAIRQTVDALATRAGIAAPGWEQIKRDVPADGVYRPKAVSVAPCDDCDQRPCTCAENARAEAETVTWLLQTRAGREIAEGRGQG